MRHRIELAKLPDLEELDRLFREHRKSYGDETLKQKAREDGALNIPRVAAPEPAPYEKELTYAAARLASMVSTRYKGPLELIDAKIKAEREYVERKLKNGIEKIEAIYQTEKEAAEDSYGMKDSHKQLEKAESHYDSMYNKYGRGPIEYIPHWLYVVMAGMIFLGEIPLNALVFQVFGESQVMVWVMAFIVGLSIPVIAHFIGIKAREHGDGFSWMNTIKATIAMAGAVMALYALSIMRQTYLAANKEALGLTDPLIQSTFGFFWLNVAVLGAASMISYLCHDPVPGFQDAKNDCIAARKRVETKERTRLERLKACAIIRARMMDGSNTEYRDGVNLVNILKGTYDQLLKEGQECESRCLDRLRQEISMYRHENLRHREDKDMPKSFNIEHEFELELQKFKEKLNNDEPDRSTQAA